jgi:hypothetical protein
MAHLLTRKRCAVGAEFRRRSIGAALVRFGNQSVFVLQPHVLVKGSRNQCGFLFLSVLYPSSPAGPLYHVGANSCGKRWFFSLVCVVFLEEWVL